MFAYQGTNQEEGTTAEDSTTAEQKTGFDADNLDIDD